MGQLLPSVGKTQNKENETKKENALAARIARYSAPGDSLRSATPYSAASFAPPQLRFDTVEDTTVVLFFIP